MAHASSYPPTSHSHCSLRLCRLDRTAPRRPQGRHGSLFFFSSRRRHTRCSRDWSSDVCSSDLSPANGATVSGTITVTANASDNVGVASVQFQLDGANLGSLDTTSPYSVSWNTATASNSSHILRAVAKDAAGNSTTSASVTVTVSNAADTAAPSVPTGLGATGVSSAQ